MVPAQAVEHLAAVLSDVEKSVLFATCIDERGWVGASNCFVWPKGRVHMIPRAHVIELPKRMEAPTVMLTSRCPGQGMGLPEAELVQFTEFLMAEAAESGIKVLDHYLVTDEGLISMRETTSLWSNPWL